MRSEIAFKDIPEEWQGKIKAYSDHYGVATTFEWQEAPPKPAISPAALHETLVDDIKDVLETSRRMEQENQPRHGIHATLWGIGALAALVLGKTKTKRREFLRNLLGTVGILSLAGMGLQISLGSQTAQEITAYEEIVKKLKSLQA